MSAERFFFWIIGGLFGIIFTRWMEKYRTAELHRANEELLERLHTVTGQLANERRLLALRINRAHEGACKAARTRKALRIKLPEVVT